MSQFRNTFQTVANQQDWDDREKIEVLLQCIESPALSEECRGELEVEVFKRQLTEDEVMTAERVYYNRCEKS